VWRATDEVQGRVVAVRRMGSFGPPAAAASVRDRVLREARAAASRRHPNVVVIFDVVVDAGEPWVIREFVAGPSLAGMLAERGPLPVQEVAAIGAQVASALAVVHAAGVVHRNVNLGNIRVAWPYAKLDDLGITPPEATPVVDPRNDVHALGGARYAAIGGHGGASRAWPLMWVLAAMTAADPTARLTAAQAEVMLRDVAAGRARPSPAGTGRRSPPIGLAIGLVAAVIATGAAFLGSRPADVPGPVPAISAAAPTSAPAPRAIGDPRTADPCALVDEPALRRHGLTDVVPYYGAMTSCWAFVAVRPATEVVVSVELMSAAFVPEQSGGVPEERGPLRLVR
jgi:serine/threonine protein kinase